MDNRKGQSANEDWEAHQKSAKINEDSAETKSETEVKAKQESPTVALDDKNGVHTGEPQVTKLPQFTPKKLSGSKKNDCEAGYERENSTTKQTTKKVYSGTDSITFVEGVQSHVAPQSLAGSQVASVDNTLRVGSGLIGGSDIIITDQDVLFGRGGLTNRHIGNLRYREMISTFREDYVQASRSGKPNVAKSIVHAIRFGESPGRFLKRGHDGKWHEVSDQEAAWKASQALREKTRWSCMKEHSPSSNTSDLDESGREEELPQTPKRQLNFNQPLDPTTSGGLGRKKKKINSSNASALNIPIRGEFSVPTVAVAPLIPSTAHLASQQFANQTESGGIKILDGPSSKFGSVPAGIPNTASKLLPRDEDVLFGRGGGTNNHPGNKRLRAIVNQYRFVYAQSRKVDKPKVSKLIVEALRGANPPSRFLRMDDDTNQWVEVGDRRAAEKVSQTLREKDRG